jgi:nucleotide-binding universal stress UspA family protein
MLASHTEKTPDPLERVVLATDLGPDSVDLFAHGLSLALRSGAELFLVHIQDDEHPGASWRRLPAVRTLLERWGVLAPSATPEQLEALGIRVQPLVYRPTDGDLSAALARRVSELNPDLLLLGPQIRSWFEETARPSVARPVARQLRRPTVFLSDRARGWMDPETGDIRLRRVLVPVASEVPQQPLMDMLVRLLDGLRTGPVQITFVHAGAHDSLVGVSLRAHPDWSYRFDRRQGPVTGQILQAAIEHEADLIAMATQGHDSWLDVVQGSTTERVLQHAGCPVLAVPV